MTLRGMNIKWSLALLPILLVLVGCPFSPDKNKEPIDPPVSEYLERTSISNVLYNLKLSYNKKNIEEYKLLLHSEFTNVFDPNDIGGEHDIPESWGYADEVASATNLFGNQPNADGYRCETISLAFTAGADVESQYPGWRKVTLTQVQLNVDTRHKDSGDQLLYQVLGDQADLFFVQTDETNDQGAKLWRIIRWEDKPVGAKLLAKN